MDEPTTCQACAAAAADPDTGLGEIGCPQCRVRELANSPGFHASMLARRIIPAYRAALVREFGAEGWERGHLQVKACDSALRAARLERAQSAARQIQR